MSCMVRTVIEKNNKQTTERQQEKSSKTKEERKKSEAKRPQLHTCIKKGKTSKAKSKYARFNLDN